MENNTTNETNGEVIESANNVIVKSMEDIMHEAMIPYSEYVILDRALPRVEDGLKPVQRRILYAMHELGIRPDTPYRKCARIVGDCLGKYHPHGDSSVYGALVRMAQPFNMRACQIDGQGNFGSVDGDGAAAMRYTEARLTPLATELLRDIEKNTVTWSCNFDDTLKEPDVLPGRYPNLLVNGATGIAVGLATNIPPHNLAETIDGVCAYLDNPRIKLEAMMKIIKAPDFPTGGYVIGGEELVRAYETGRGKVLMRAKVHIEEADYDKKLIVIDELPYQVNKSSLLESILKVKEEKKGVLAFISDITDESDRNGMRAVIKVKKDGDTDAILQMLFKYTNLSTSFGINMVAIADGKPQQMGLLDIIAYYADYQREVIIRRCRFELDAAKRRAHILEGLVIAVRNIDEVVKIIKTSQSTTEAREKLRKRFDLSEIQAQAILDLRLARLTHLEVFKLEQELKELKAEIIRLTDIISSKKLQTDLIKSEMLQIKRTYKDTRRTEVLKLLGDYTVQDETADKPIEDCYVAVNAFGAVKRMNAKHFGMATRDFSSTTTKNEICSNIIRTDTSRIIYCFTNLGNCYKLDSDMIPQAKWKEKGGLLSKIFPAALEGERIIYIYAVGDDLPKGKLLFYTKNGMVKKTAWSEYALAKSYFQSAKFKEGDEIIAMEEEKAGCSLMFITSGGICLNADMTDIPVQGRISGGVKGIQLSDDDYCIFAGQITPQGELLVITDNGFGKKVLSSDIDVLARYRKGVKIIDIGKQKQSGTSVILGAYITEPTSVVIIDEDGYMMAFSSEDVNTENRTNAGKQIFRGKVKITEGYIYNNNETVICDCGDTKKK